MEPFKCPHCGNAVHVLETSCIFCGKPVRTDEEILKMHTKGYKVCFWCGFICEEDSNFCKICGNPFNRDATESKENREVTKELYDYLESLNNSGAKKFLSKLKNWGKEK